MNTVERSRPILTPEQAAAELQVNRETIDRYIRQGKLLASRIGRRYRIPRRNLDRLLWETRTRPDIVLREYSDAQIAGFLRDDALDEQAQEVVVRFGRDAAAP
jgi:excisionase family DNA binding protein